MSHTQQLEGKNPKAVFRLATPLLLDCQTNVTKFLGDRVEKFPTCSQADNPAF